jgi:hypothetical protein
MLHGIEEEESVNRASLDPDGILVLGIRSDTLVPETKAGDRC